MSQKVPAVIVRIFAVAAMAALGPIACGGGGGDGDGKVPASVTIVAGNGQTAVAGTELPAALDIVVRNAAGKPIADASVTWTVVAGGGSVTPGSGMTDRSGVASTRWTLGPALGANRVTATAGTLPAVTFEATGTAGPASNLSLVSGDGQEGKVGTDLPAALTVLVTDSAGRPVGSAPVSWTVTVGGGAIEPANDVTDSSGGAAARWTLGPAAGVQWATAVVAGLTPVSFKATAFEQDPALMPRYTAVTLGGLDGRHGNVRGINARGDVVGDSLSPLQDPPRMHAVVYTAAGTIVDLGTLGGAESSANAINDAGDVVGWSLTADGLQRAFVYRNGVMQDLGTLGGLQSAATDINEHGEVVGWAQAVGGQMRAFVHRGGVMQDLGTFGGAESSANAINEAGQVVGSAQNSSGERHAFLYAHGTLRDLGPLGGPTSDAQGINAAGDIVGSAITSGGAEDAFLYRDGTMLALGCGSRTGPAGVGSYTKCRASAINSSGLVVGSMTSGREDSPRATQSAWQLWGGVVTDFRLAGEQVGVMQANDVNDAGQVVAMTNLGPFTGAGLPAPVDPLRLDPVKVPAGVP